MNGDTIEYHHKFNGKMFIYNSGTESIPVIFTMFPRLFMLAKKKRFVVNMVRQK
jgi:hypothetical protein